jgi:hypothetical protein
VLRLARLKVSKIILALGTVAALRLELICGDSREKVEGQQQHRHGKSTHPFAHGYDTKLSGENNQYIYQSETSR